MNIIPRVYARLSPLSISASLPVTTLLRSPTSFLKRYKFTQLWLTLLLFIVVPVCGMQLNSILCLQMKNHWFWRECAWHVQTEAFELTVYQQSQPA